MLEKLEKGWGIGYRGAKFVSCKKLPPEERPTINQYIDCELSAENETIHLYGTEVHFNNIDIVKFSGHLVFANNEDLSPISCYVDSGLIMCHREKKK